MDEYISKQSVIDYLKGYLNSIGERGADSLFDRGQRRALINSIQDISVIKSADVQPVKHGKWINNGYYATCTICGGSSGTQYDGVEPIPKTTSYCPDCGARMDGDSE